MPHPIADTFGPNLADWLDTDEHRDQAHTLLQLIATKDGPYIAAAWLIGMNPHLNDDSPLQAIRNGHSADARAAARAYLND
ncbi:hypothetical protein [Streptomyces lydicus]|uniref:hypothetical protein n=1 Tax=Streptomyces lydicus TaxID=47763 RepID=UPI00379280F2